MISRLKLCYIVTCCLYLRFYYQMMLSNKIINIMNEYCLYWHPLTPVCLKNRNFTNNHNPLSFSVTTAALGELMGGRQRYGGVGTIDSALPFVEMESCTASKQEHIVSVNLRELSLHLLKHGTQNSLGRLRSSCTPLHVHALSTRYVAAQLETSRLLCQMLCKAANVDPRHELERGFCLMLVYLHFLIYVCVYSSTYNNDKSMYLIIFR